MNTQPTIKNFLILILPAILVVFAIFFIVMPRVRENREQNNQPSVTNFEECVAAGNPVMESYPRQCRHGEETFTEEIKQIVGGDKDEHGCIGLAGYSWCEPKNKCLRVWEEACYESVEQDIQRILADKYNKSTDTVNITINKQVEGYAAGSVVFGAGGPGEAGMFLARQVGNRWEVLFDGNGAVNCQMFRLEYGFPDEILKPNFCD